MATKTITGRDILFLIAENVDAIKSAYVTTGGSTTSVTCGALNGQVDANAYQYSIGRILGKGDCLVSSHTAAGVFTVATLSSSPATNDVFQWAWWTGNKVGDAISAMNEAIRYSWPYFYRERQTGTGLTGTVAKAGTTALTGTNTLFLTELNVGDLVSVPGGAGTEIREIATITSNTAATVTSSFANTASGQTATLASNITLASGTYRYALPTSADAVLAIGIAPASSPVTWFEWGDESSRYWRVEGQRGNYYLNFESRFSREGTIPDMFNGTTLQVWYATREPELSDLTSSTCQLPKDYFIVGAQIYSVRNLQSASRVDLVTANVAIPQLQDSAKNMIQVLGIGKRPPNRLMNPDVAVPEYQRINEESLQGDTSVRVYRGLPQQQGK